MVRIRLRRVGAKGQPSYRIVVADSRSPRDGRFIETIGFYNPRTDPSTMVVREDRALYWLGVGAQPSEPVHRILDKLGTLGRFERLRQGESLEALVAEAAVAESPPVDSETAPEAVEAPTVEAAEEAEAAETAAEAETAEVVEVAGA